MRKMMGFEITRSKARGLKPALTWLKPALTDLKAGVLY